MYINLRTDFLELRGGRCWMVSQWSVAVVWTSGLRFLPLSHDLDYRILSIMLLSNLSSLSNTTRFSIKPGNCARLAYGPRNPFPKASLLFFVRARLWCTQAESPSQIKPGSQCLYLVLLFLFPSFSKAVHASETANACFLGNILPRPRHGFESKLPISLSSLLSKMG